MTKRTIYRHLLLLAALPALVLAACSREDLAGTTDNGPEDADATEIRFEIGFTPQTATRVATSADALFKCTWEDGDAIGIYAVEHGERLAAAGNPIHNVKMTYSTSGAAQWSGRAYWPAADGRKLDFYAYYPYDPSFTDPTKSLEFSAKTDQSAVTGGRSHFSLSDLMMANQNNNTGYGRGETVALSFEHLMAMVQVKVSSSMLGNYDPSALKVSLNGCYTGVTRLNLPNRGGSFEPTSSPETITMYPCPNDGTPGIYAYRALVPPGQRIAPGTAMFRFDYSDGTVLLRSQPLTKEIGLGKGRVETFDMTFPSSLATVSANVRLNDLFTESELAAITHLRVFGEMTQADFTTIRDKMPALTNLDLGGATVVGTITIDYDGNTVNGNAILYVAFYEKTSLKEFIFPQNITAIGDGAFEGCSGLTGSLTIPSSVTTIGESAFYGCSGFNGALTIPEGVTTIGRHAFGGCSGFNGALAIPEGVTTIGGHAFYGCSGFNGALTIPSSVTAIGYVAFNECKNLKSITCRIPDLGQVTCDRVAFNRVPKTITLYVPGGMESTYQSTEPWNRFQTIKPISTP